MKRTKEGEGEDRREEKGKRLRGEGTSCANSNSEFLGHARLLPPAALWRVDNQGFDLAPRPHHPPLVVMNPGCSCSWWWARVPSAVPCPPRLGKEMLS